MNFCIAMPPAFLRLMGMACPTRGLLVPQAAVPCAAVTADDAGFTIFDGVWLGNTCWAMAIVEPPLWSLSLCCVRTPRSTLMGVAHCIFVLSWGDVNGGMGGGGYPCPWAERARHELSCMHAWMHTWVTAAAAAASMSSVVLSRRPTLVL